MARRKSGKEAQYSPELAQLPKGLIESARIEEDRRVHDRYSTDRRRSDRASVDAQATLGTSPTDAVEGQLYSLSAEGCSIKVSAGSFAAGDKVWFAIENLRPLSGTVRWVDGDNAGVEFERPFYQPVFELIVHSNKPVILSKAA